MPWCVEVAGSEQELSVLLGALDSTELFAARYGRNLLLAGATLDEIQDRELLAVTAARMVRLLRGALRIAIVDLDIDVELASVQVVSASTAPARADAAPSTDAVWVRRYLGHAVSDPAVRDALMLAGVGLYWEDIAQLQEIIARTVGGTAQIVELGWATKAQLARLTPQFAGQALPRAVTVLALRLVRRWLAARGV